MFVDRSPMKIDGDFVSSSSLFLKLHHIQTILLFFFLVCQTAEQNPNRSRIINNTEWIRYVSEYELCSTEYSADRGIHVDF